MPSVNIGGRVLLALAALAVLLVPPWPAASDAASHREAPLIALDPSADITDFFFFRSYEPGRDDKVVLLMDVFPGGEASSGPNYFNFDPNVRYSFHVDDDKDGAASDTRIDVQFRTEPVRGVIDQLNLFLAYVALPPITSLDGAGSEGLGVRQRYRVTINHHGRTYTVDQDKNGKPLFAVPANVGPRTTPNYEALAAQGSYQLSNGVRVFAGQRSDPFYIDLGAVFDTVNARRSPPVLTAGEDANDGVNPFGIDTIGTFNVQAIALELPISMLTADGKAADTQQPKLGAYASTSRRRTTSLRGEGEARFFRNTETDGDWVQVQRLANPLVNEAIIGTEDKDRWNSERPGDEREFLDYYLNPRLARALEIVTGVPAAKENRNDLVSLLLRYAPSDRQLSELLRLDVSVSPTALADQRRMTVLADTPDPAGWPNGRRPKDDVTDIALRVVGGANYVAARAGDGVNTNFRSLSATFPFLATPQNGRDRVHQNPSP
jgi:Domain of unknown function (DUF4331)